MYNEKLKDLRVTGDEVKARAMDFETRPKAEEAMRQAIVHFRKFLENGAWRHAKKAEKPAEPPAPEPSARPDIAAPPPPPADGSPTATTTLRRNPGRACKSPVRYNK